MQGGPSLDVAALGLPGIVLGLVIGYTIAGMQNLRVIDRLLLGIVISSIGGLILSLAISIFIPMGSLEMLFVILSFLGGYILGLVLNWESPHSSKPNHHIIYEPDDDDDDEFDREIEDALGGRK